MKEKFGIALGLAAVLGLLALLPFRRTDVAELVPIEALVVAMEHDSVVVDGGECRGCGETWQTAWQDLLNSGNGTVFLGTAEQIVLVGAAVELLPEVAWNEQLRPAAVVCVSPGPAPDVKEAAAYLGSHNGGVTLQQVRMALLQERAIDLPVLVETEGGMRLYGTKNR